MTILIGTLLLGLVLYADIDPDDKLESGSRTLLRMACMMGLAWVIVSIILSLGLGGAPDVAHM